MDAEVLGRIRMRKLPYYCMVSLSERSMGKREKTPTIGQACVPPAISHPQWPTPILEKVKKIERCISFMISRVKCEMTTTGIEHRSSGPCIRPYGAKSAGRLPGTRTCLEYGTTQMLHLFRAVSEAFEMATHVIHPIQGPLR